MTGTSYAAGRIKTKPGVFWQWQRVEPGDTFLHRGTEFTVDNVVACPSGGWEVVAHPSALIADARTE